MPSKLQHDRWVWAIAILVGVVSLAAASLATSQKQQQQRLSNMRSGATVAGASYVGMAFNAKNASMHYTWPVVDWTFAEGKTWTSPVTQTAYLVPDQVSLVNTCTSATKIVDKATTQFTSFWSSYFSWHVFAFGFFTLVFDIGFESVSELGKVHLELTERGKLMSFSQYFESYYQLNMQPSFAVTPGQDFKYFVSRLPPNATTAENQAVYHEFMQQVGTHYVCTGLFGGSVHLNTYVDFNLTQTYSMQEMVHQFGLVFNYMLFGIAAGHFKAPSDIKFATWFANNQKSYLYWNGGEYQNALTVDQWRLSLPDQPGLLGSTLCPITDLITWDPIRKQALEGYIAMYLNSTGTA